MLILIKKIWNNSINKYNLVVNLIHFKIQNVTIHKTFHINGKIKIYNKGNIFIDKNFKANSGKKYNPIGGDTILRLMCHEGGEIHIGRNTGISNSTFVAKEKIIVGNNVMIGGGCKFWDNDFHSLDPQIRISSNDSDISSAPIIINDYAFIGGGTIILKGVEVGKNSIVAAGSVVTKSIPNNEIWGGNPACYIRDLQK